MAEAEVALQILKTRPSALSVDDPTSNPMVSRQETNQGLTVEDYQSVLARAIKQIVEGQLAKEASIKRRRASLKPKLDEQIKKSCLARLVIRIPVFGEPLAHKYLSSKLVAYLEGEGVTSDDVDTLVNSVTLVNALLLTIPPGIIISLNQELWDGLQQNIASCEIDGSQLFWYEYVYIPIYYCMFASFSSCLCGMVIAIAYYILRPSSSVDQDEDVFSEFRKWWSHGKISVLFLIMSVMCSAVSLILTLLYYMIWIVNNQGHLCDLVQSKVDHGPLAMLPMQKGAIASVACVIIPVIVVSGWFLA